MPNASAEVRRWNGSWSAMHRAISSDGKSAHIFHPENLPPRSTSHRQQKEHNHIPPPQQSARLRSLPHYAPLAIFDAADSSNQRSTLVLERIAEF